MRPLGDAPVWALGIDTCEEEAELPVHPPPYRTHRRLIARGEEYGALVAARRGTGTGDPQGGQVDLDGDGARLLGVAPESRPDERSAPVQRAGDWNQKARRRTDGTVEEFPLAHTAERNGRARHGLEGLDLTPRDLEEAPREGGDDRASGIHAHAESEGERELAGRRCVGVAGDEEEAERVDLCDPRQAEGRQREGCDDTSGTDRIVVGVERIQAQAPEAFIGR